MGNSFIFDEEEPEQPEEMGAEAETEAGGGEPGGEDEGGSNRTFLIAVGVLGGVVLLALLCLAVYAGFLLPRQRRAAEAQQAAQLVQNTQIAAAATAAASGFAYNVQAGDSLSSIAAQFGVTVDELLNANPGLGDTLSPGQHIVIPGAAGGPAYTVQSGDTLLSIATRLGIALDALRNANPGVGDTPSPGQIIVIPIVVAPRAYTVQSGDTLASIAAQFGVALDALRNANPGVADTPSAGQTIVIPGAGSTSTYTVQQGDTVLSIAARFGLTVDQLRNANPNLGDTLTPGGTLVIPGVAGLLPSPQVSVTATAVVVFPTSTPILVETVNPITATVAAAYTQAALAQLTVIPTSTALGAVPSTGFADEVGLPLIFILGAIFLVVIFVVRRVRTAQP
jgi:LysM repeat protein